MQTSICFTSKDRWLMDRVRQKAEVERKSQSAVILAILEESFVKGKRIGQILKGMYCLSGREVTRALETQEQGKTRRLLGEILVEQDIVNRKQLERALVIQDHLNGEN